MKQHLGITVPGTWTPHSWRGDAPPPQASTIRSVGIIGAGIMGTAIAAAHIQHGLRVVICDSSDAALARVNGAVEAALRNAQPHLPPDVSSLRRLLQPTAELAAVVRSDLIVESIAETLSAKQQLYAQLRPHLGSRSIVASNTSTIPITRLAAGMDAPTRFCGVHFFHPVDRRPLVEVVCGPQTSQHTVATVVAHAKRIGRRPIVVDDGPGFVVNRLLFPFLTESLELLCEGVKPEDIDHAATQFGMAMGPLRLMDEIGLDTTLHAGWVLATAFPERIVASPLLVTMVKSGELGCKSGAGFFFYDDGGDSQPPARVNPLLAGRINQWALPARAYDLAAITDRLILPMVLEASRLLEEGKSLGPADIDLGAVLGLGFPTRRGGLLRWADSLGASEIIRRLQMLGGVGPRYQPPAMLIALAQRGGTFYARHDPSLSFPSAVCP